MTVERDIRDEWQTLALLGLLFVIVILAFYASRPLNSDHRAWPILAFTAGIVVLRVGRLIGKAIGKKPKHLLDAAMTRETRPP